MRTPPPSLPPGRPHAPRVPVLRAALALLVATGAARPGPASAQTRTFDLLTASVEDIQAAVAAGALTYERLVQLYLARIEAYDQRGPALNAVLTPNPRALEVARERDAERARSGLRSPLHGIPIAVKDVVDVHAALQLSYMRGFDAEDLFTWESLGRLDPEPYTVHLDDRGLVGARIGVFRDLFRRGEEFQPINRVIEEEIDFIRRQDAVVVDGLTIGMDLVSFFPQARASVEEFRFVFDAYLKRRGPDTPVRSLEELMATGDYLQNLEGFFRRAMGVASPDYDRRYLSRLENRLTIRGLIVELMDRHGFDALVHPFKSLAAPPLGTGDRGPRDNPISAITGLPAIVVPAGVNAEGLPIAIEFLGRPFSEPTLIRLAHAYEVASRRRVAPTTTPHLPGEVFTYEVGR